MNKDLIELQKGIKATCVVIRNEDVKELDNVIIVDKKNVTNNITNPNEITYLVLSNFDLLDESAQNEYLSLIKDRHYMGNDINDNIIIVLTVASKETLKKISKEIYHFCVVAF